MATDIRAAAAMLPSMAAHFSHAPAYSMQFNDVDDDGRPSYYERNRDQVRENQRLYRESNREKIRAIHKAYYLKNRAKITAYKRERWHQKKAGSANGENTKAKRSRSVDSSTSSTCPSSAQSPVTAPSKPATASRMNLHMLLNPATLDD